MMPLIDPRTEADLLRRLKSGDAAALSGLYRQHSAPLYRFALLHTGAAHAAADVVQDAFLALIGEAGRFDPARGSVQGYLFGIARNLARRSVEGGRRFLPHEADGGGDGDGPPDDTPAPLERLLRDETIEAVRAALLRVPAHYREVVILYEMHDFSYAEAAEICGIDIGTVRSRLHRGRSLLAALLTRAGLTDGRPVTAAATRGNP